MPGERSGAVASAGRGPALPYRDNQG